MSHVTTLDEQLEGIAPYINWDKFEETTDGNLSITDPTRTWPESDEPYTYDCHLRVGTHMGQPMQTVMSCGRFVKMRKYDDEGLKYPYAKLDPKNPNSALYSHSGWNTPVTMFQQVPPVYLTSYAQQSANQYGNILSNYGAITDPGHTHTVHVPTPTFTWNPKIAFDYLNQTVTAGMVQYPTTSWLQGTPPSTQWGSTSANPIYSQLMPYTGGYAGASALPVATGNVTPSPTTTQGSTLGFAIWNVANNLFKI